MHVQEEEEGEERNKADEQKWNFMLVLSTLREVSGITYRVDLVTE